jgi:GntR family transcriptional regulator/MocR family aminotransferase
MATPSEVAVNRLHGSFIPPMSLDFSSETPLYRQICMWFQRSILSGQLQPGQRIPSTRALASALKISRIPVLSAYELLIAEGYFEAYGGAGTFVSRSLPVAFYRPEPESAVQIPIAPHPKARRAISRRGASLRGSAQKWLEGARGCIDIRHFPNGIWSKLLRRHARKVSRQTLGYGEPMGYLPFREAVAEYLGAFRAVKCHPAQILVTTGSQQALQISALALLDPGDSAWIEEPGYPGTQQALKARTHPRRWPGDERRVRDPRGQPCARCLPDARASIPDERHAERSEAHGAARLGGAHRRVDRGR